MRSYVFDRFVEADDAPAGTTHLLHKRFLAYPANGSEFSVLVELFDLAKLTERHVRGIVGFGDDGTEKLRLEDPKRVSLKTTIVHFVQIMYLRQERALQCAQCLSPIIVDCLAERRLWRTRPDLAQRCII